MRRRQHNLHLPPCVYHRHGAYYHVKAGKWTRLGTDLPKALSEYVRMHDMRKGGMVQLIEDAVPHITREVKDSTADQYKIAAKKLQGILEEFAPHQVKQSTVYAMQDGLASTPNMANRCLSVLRLVFTYAVKRGIVEHNPCTGVDRLREKKRDRLIEHDEFSLVRQKAAPRLQLMMDIAYLTGQRIMDVATIHRSAIREEGIYFKQEKTEAKLLVAWTPELRQAVEKAKALGGKVNAMTLFYTRHGTAPSYRTVYDQWVSACKRAGIGDTDMRDIRAMSATNAKRQGKDATALLGHASQAMTDRYLRDRDVPVVHGPAFGQSK